MIELERQVLGHEVIAVVLLPVQVAAALQEDHHELVP